MARKNFSVSSVLLKSCFSRREVIAATAFALSGITIAQTRSTVPAPSGVPPKNPFMVLSHLLIDHALDPTIGSRIAALLKADSSPISEIVDNLIALAQSRKATIVEDFFPAATEAQQKFALSVISAWYLGVVDDKPGAQVFAYELALMFQPTLDVSTIPTYAISGPNAWGSKSPSLSAMPAF